MQAITLYKVCTACGGTGQLMNGLPGEQTTATCQWPGCNGSGFVTLGKIELDPGLDDVMDKLDDVLDKCQDILTEVSA